MISKASVREQITADEIDDVLYLARADEAQEFSSVVAELAQKYDGAGEGEVIEAAVERESGNTALHYCAANGHTALLQTILTKAPGTRLVNKCNVSGNTPLHWASVNGHVQTVEVLVRAGSDLWLRNQAGNLAVFEAERAGKDDVVALLLKVGGTQKEQEEDAKKEEEEEEQDGGSEESGEDAKRGDPEEENEEGFTMRAGELDDVSRGGESDAINSAQVQLQNTSLDE